MRFTVTWTDAVEEFLLNRWLQLPEGERQEFTRRVDWLDRSLRENAHQKGSRISQQPRLRFLAPPEFFEPPTVGVVYAVSEDDRLVEVLELHVDLLKP